MRHARARRARARTAGSARARACPVSTGWSGDICGYPGSRAHGPGLSTSVQPARSGEVGQHAPTSAQAARDGGIGRHAPPWLAQTGCAQICRQLPSGARQDSRMGRQHEIGQVNKRRRGEAVTRRALVGHRAVTLPGQTSNDGDGRQLQSGSEQERRAVGGRPVIMRRDKSAVPAGHAPRGVAVASRHDGRGPRLHRHGQSTWRGESWRAMACRYTGRVSRSRVEADRRGQQGQRVSPGASRPGFVGAYRRAAWGSRLG
jgi:hypothetical protein